MVSRSILFRTAMVFPILATFLLSGAQSTEEILYLGSAGNDYFSDLVQTPEGDLVVAIVFDEDLTLGTKTLTSRGREDICLLKYSPSNQAILWALQLGGPLDDRINSLAINQEGAVLLGGSFGLSIEVGSIPLESGNNSKALFLAKLDADGTADWAKAFQGNGVQELTHLQIDLSEEILITGYFEGKIEWQQDSLKAVGDQDFFVIRTDQNGVVKWHYNSGGTNNTQAKRIATMPDGGFVVAGNFDGHLQIDSFQLTANTNDDDVFLVKFDREGQVLWLEKAGGVFEDNLQDLATDNLGNIYAFGHFFGRMRLNDSINLESVSRNHDLFLLSFKPNGKIRKAVVIGNTSVQNAVAMIVGDQAIRLTGNYKGGWSPTGTAFPGVQRFQGFYLILDHELGIIEARPVATPRGSLFTNGMIEQTEQSSILSISFDGSYKSDTQPERPAAGKFDGMVISLKEMTRPVQIQDKAPPAKIKVFPNPARRQVSIESDYKVETIELVDGQGKHIQSWRKPSRNLNIPDCPPGTYFLKIRTDEGLYIKKLDLQ